MGFAGRLTFEDAEEIRAIYAGGGWTQARLATIYGVGQTHICKIVLGQRLRNDRPARVTEGDPWDIDKLIAISEGRNAAIAALGGSGFPRAAVRESVANR